MFKGSSPVAHNILQHSHKCSKTTNLTMMPAGVPLPPPLIPAAPNQLQRIADCEAWYSRPNRYSTIAKIPKDQVADAANGLLDGYKNTPVGYQELLAHPSLVPSGPGSLAARTAILCHNARTVRWFVGRLGSTWATMNAEFIQILFYLGDRAIPFWIMKAFPMNAKGGTLFSVVMAHQANGFIAYILACIILGPQDAAHGPFKTLRQMKAASAFGRFNGAHAAAYQEAYYCFVLCNATQGFTKC